MLKNTTFSVAFVSVYLLLYCILTKIPETAYIATWMFLLSPVLVIWMVYAVLKFSKYTGPELSDKQEFGYQDKQF